MIAAIRALVAVIVILFVALLFSQAAAKRAADRAALDFANAMASEIKRKTEKLRAENAAKATAYEAQVPQKSDPDLEAEINK